nr:hypothetical protein [Fictibacillus sp. KU28468]
MMDKVELISSAFSTELKRSIRKAADTSHKPETIRINAIPRTIFSNT